MNKRRKYANHMYPNSHGLSKVEYTLGSQAGHKNSIEVLNDFDYLDKLSPEEFSFLSEFMNTITHGYRPDPTIIGKENHDHLTKKENLRSFYNSKNARIRSFNNRAQSVSMNKRVSTEGSYDDALDLEFCDDSYSKMIQETEQEITKHWIKTRKEKYYGNNDD